MVNPIAVAIPGFFVLIGIEVAASWRRGRLAGPRPDYRWVDAITDLACGVSSQVTGMFLAAVVAAGAYTWTWTHLRLTDLGAGLATWMGTFVAVDLLYYLWHRASHRVNALWAAHVVHHQSEDYNLAVALRQAIFTAITSIPFYQPLAILGVPPLVFLTCTALNTLYQFWIHTRLVGRLGPLEAVLNTPSHHRVHHGINPRYIDRNHAGVFIVWDRLFGTFTPEADEPVYGVVEGWRSANALRANLDPWRKLAALSGSLSGWDRLRVWWMPPEWRPDGDVVIPEPTPALRFDPRVAPAVVAYVVAWFVVCAVVLTLLLFLEASLPVTLLCGAGGAVLWATWTWGLLFDGERRALAAEGLRLGWCVAVGFAAGPAWGIAASVLALASALALVRLHRHLPGAPPVTPATPSA